jgi:transposase
MPPRTIRKRTLIIWRLGQGVPQREIAREVPCSQSTVSRIDQNWILDRQLEPKYHGSTRKTTEDEDQRIIEA